MKTKYLDVNGLKVNGLKILFLYNSALSTEENWQIQQDHIKLTMPVKWRKDNKERLTNLIDSCHSLWHKALLEEKEKIERLTDYLSITKIKFSETSFFAVSVDDREDYLFSLFSTEIEKIGKQFIDAPVLNPTKFRRGLRHIFSSWISQNDKYFNFLFGEDLSVRLFKKFWLISKSELPFPHPFWGHEYENSEFLKLIEENKKEIKKFLGD